MSHSTVRLHCHKCEESFEVTAEENMIDGRCEGVYVLDDECPLCGEQGQDNPKEDDE